MIPRLALRLATMGLVLWLAACVAPDTNNPTRDGGIGGTGQRLE